MWVKEWRATGHFIGDIMQGFSSERRMTFTGTTEYTTNCAVSALVKKLKWSRKQGFCLYITLAVAEKQINTDTSNLQIT